MKQIVAFGASSSKKSINKDLACYAASVIEDANVLLLDLNDFEMPIYSIDYENDHGIPEKAYKFKEKLKNADGIIISFAEHNSVYTAAFKNIFDWISRIEKVVWYNKPMFLLSTSETATTILSNNFKPFLITSIWPKVIGSKVPGYIATLFIKLNYHQFYQLKQLFLHQIV